MVRRPNQVFYNQSTLIGQIQPCGVKLQRFRHVVMQLGTAMFNPQWLTMEETADILRFKNVDQRREINLSELYHCYSPHHVLLVMSCFLFHGCVRMFAEAEEKLVASGHIKEIILQRLSFICTVNVCFRVVLPQGVKRGLVFLYILRSAKKSSIFHRKLCFNYHTL